MVRARKPNNYWTKERVMEFARQFSTKSEWWQTDRSSYVTAQEKGWIKEMDWFVRKTKTKAEVNEHRRSNYRIRNHKFADPDLKDEYEFKVYMSMPVIDTTDIPPTMIKATIVEKGQEIAEVCQKEVRREWARRGYDNNIIIIESRQICYKKGTIIYRCEIHQLRMTSAIRDEFKEVCTQKIQENQQR